MTADSSWLSLIYPLNCPQHSTHKWHAKTAITLFNNTTQTHTHTHGHMLHDTGNRNSSVVFAEPSKCLHASALVLGSKAWSRTSPVSLMCFRPSFHASSPEKPREMLFWHRYLSSFGEEWFVKELGFLPCILAQKQISSLFCQRRQSGESKVTAKGRRYFKICLDGCRLILILPDVSRICKIPCRLKPTVLLSNSFSCSSSCASLQWSLKIVSAAGRWALSATTPTSAWGLMGQCTLSRR